MYSEGIKRLLDIVLASLSLMFLSPIMLGVSLVIRLDDGGPVFFTQTRIGRHGTPFQFFKFRSMPVNTGDIPSAQAGNLKVTNVGRFIRRTNIDELPQLFNILRGDMSVVGPRPAIPSQEALLTMRDENGASLCRPGLTGAAQVNSYDGMPEDEKAAWDGWYATRVSLSTDLKIVFRTFAYLIKSPPAY